MPATNNDPAHPLSTAAVDARALLNYMSDEAVLDAWSAYSGLLEQEGIQASTTGLHEQLATCLGLLKREGARFSEQHESAWPAAGADPSRPSDRESGLTNARWALLATVVSAAKAFKLIESLPTRSAEFHFFRLGGDWRGYALFEPNTFQSVKGLLDAAARTFEEYCEHVARGSRTPTQNVDRSEMSNIELAFRTERSAALGDPVSTLYAWLLVRGLRDQATLPAPISRELRRCLRNPLSRSQGERWHLAMAVYDWAVPLMDIDRTRQ